MTSIRQTIIIRRDLMKLKANAAVRQRIPTLRSSIPGTEPAPKRLYIAADDHTDYMWTSDEATYRQAFIEMLDFYLDKIDQTVAHPPDTQMRWNCDGTLWLWEYERNKSAADFARLIARVQDGHVSVPLNTLASVYGGMPTEAVLRGMYYAGKLERRHHLRFSLALAMENQTLPYGVGALWAGAGARYSWRGICDCATRIDAKTREHDIYWWTGPDGSRILLKWYSLTNNNMDLGGYAEARNPSTAVNNLDAKCDAAGYPYMVGGAFGQGWDDLKTIDTSLSFVAAATGMSNANRRVIVSNEQDFFEDFEASYGARLPSLGCTFGNEWELLCASMAEVSARVKRAVEKLRAAELMAALVSLRDPAFMTTYREACDQAWINLGMYWEHCWSAGPGVNAAQRAAWQRRVATEIESFVDTFHDGTAEALAAMIQTAGVTGQRFMVLNPLGWQRTDVADLPYTGATPAHVIDLSTGAEVPSQVVSLDGQPALRILAAEVPAAGYKVYEVREGAGQPFDGGPVVSAASGVIENDVYAVTVASRGAITGLIDKTRAGRQFVREIGGDAMNDLGPGEGTLSVENAGPVSVTLKATSPTPLSHTTRITLVRGSDRISIHNEITQNFTDVRQWRFGFEIDSPDVWHEEVGTIIRARLLANGGHYAPRNARYDWLTLNHFADISGNGIGMTLANADCYFMQLGASTLSTLDTLTPQLSPLAGGQVDGPDFGIPNQDGDAHFVQRFALRAHDSFDPAAAMRFAMEQQNPFVTRALTGNGPYPATRFSLLSLSNPDVLLWALKPAEEGAQAGIVARVWNLANAPATTTLSSPDGTLHSAEQLTHLETPLQPAPVIDHALTITLAPQQLKTFALQLHEHAANSQ